MGSRILSRSFNVEKWDAEEGQELHVPHHPDTHQDRMDVDSSVPEGTGENGEEPQHVETEEDEDESSDTAMVPMADMLNARYGSENVGCGGLYQQTNIDLSFFLCRRNCSTRNMS